jgi:two-component system, OmpR family, phosphate regulon sensor histidine kinase PhoR
VLHDITDLRRADQIRRDFVANVSHELRTPLTAIRGYVEALAEGDASPAESRRFLDIIQRHALRMERLVKDLLRLARLDAGQESLDVTRPRYARAHPGGRRRSAALARGARPAWWTSRIGPGAVAAGRRGEVPRRTAEPRGQRQRYAPESTDHHRAGRSRGGRIAISVSDRALACPTPTCRASSSASTAWTSRGHAIQGGTGLGLAIAKHLAGLQGGTIQAANRPDGGAVFTLTLPRG